MRHLRRAHIGLFYGGCALEVAGAAWGLAATDRPIPARLAFMASGYALMVLAHVLWRGAIRRWSHPASPEVWERIGRRLLEGGDLDEEFEPEPAVRARFRRIPPDRAQP